MRGDQVKKSADECGISLASAIRMRTRYLVQVIGDWEAYIEEKTDVVPPMTIGIALQEIVDLREYEARAKKGPIKGGITDDMILRAREYPITQLIEFDRTGFANCFAHEEKTGSLKHYANTNKAHCFGCGVSFDSIAVLTDRDGMSFIEAVKSLAGG